MMTQWSTMWSLPRASHKRFRPQRCDRFVASHMPSSRPTVTASQPWDNMLVVTSHCVVVGRRNCLRSPHPTPQPGQISPRIAHTLIYSLKANLPHGHASTHTLRTRHQTHIYVNHTPTTAHDCRHICRAHAPAAVHAWPCCVHFLNNNAISGPLLACGASS